MDTIGTMADEVHVERIEKDGVSVSRDGSVNLDCAPLCMYAGTTEQHIAAIIEIISLAALEDYYNQMRPIFFAQFGRPLTRKQFLDTSIACMIPPKTYIGMIRYGLAFAPISGGPTVGAAAINAAKQSIDIVTR